MKNEEEPFDCWESRTKKTVQERSINPGKTAQFVWGDGGGVGVRLREGEVSSEGVTSAQKKQLTSEKLVGTELRRGVQGISTFGKKKGGGTRERNGEGKSII